MSCLFVCADLQAVPISLVDSLNRNLRYRQHEDTVPKTALHEERKAAGVDDFPRSRMRGETPAFAAPQSHDDAQVELNGSCVTLIASETASRSDVVGFVVAKRRNRET